MGFEHTADCNPGSPGRAAVAILSTLAAVSLAGSANAAESRLFEGRVQDGLGAAITGAMVTVAIGKGR